MQRARTERSSRNFRRFWLVGTSLSALGAGACVLTGTLGMWMIRATHDAMRGADPISADDLQASSYILTSFSIGSLAIAFALVVVASAMGFMAWLSHARPT